MTESFPVLEPEGVDQVLAAGGLVLLDFWQATCPPCRALEPRLAKFAARHPGVVTGYRIDVDTDTQTPARFAVMSIPTLVLLRDGTEIARRDGFRGADAPTANQPRPQRRAQAPGAAAPGIPRRRIRAPCRGA
jgi:thiol-disulfide isomerase/thioredoxin